MDCILKYERDGLRTVYREMQKHPATVWTVQEVLHAFIDQYCEVPCLCGGYSDTKCGNYGFILLWASLPPKKLCVYCNDKLEFVDLGIGISHFGLGFSQVETIPRFRANETNYVLVESLRKFSFIQGPNRFDSYRGIRTFASMCSDVGEISNGALFSWGPMEVSRKNYNGVFSLHLSGC